MEKAASRRSFLIVTVKSFRRELIRYYLADGKTSREEAAEKADSFSFLDLNSFKDDYLKNRLKELTAGNWEGVSKAFNKDVANKNVDCYIMGRFGDNICSIYKVVNYTPTTIGDLFGARIKDIFTDTLNKIKKNSVSDEDRINKITEAVKTELGPEVNKQITAIAEIRDIMERSAIWHEGEEFEDHYKYWLEMGILADEEKENSGYNPNYGELQKNRYKYKLSYEEVSEEDVKKYCGVYEGARSRFKNAVTKYYTEEDFLKTFKKSVL